MDSFIILLLIKLLSGLFILCFVLLQLTHLFGILELLLIFGLEHAFLLTGDKDIVHAVLDTFRYFALDASCLSYLHLLRIIVDGLLSKDDECLLLLLLLGHALLNAGVDVDNESHDDVDDDVLGQAHESEEEEIGGGSRLYSKVELHPDELPVVEEHHGEQG